MFLRNCVIEEIRCRLFHNGFERIQILFFGDTIFQRLQLLVPFEAIEAEERLIVAYSDRDARELGVAVGGGVVQVIEIRIQR